MFRPSLVSPVRRLFPLLFSRSSNSQLKNFNQKTFDYFSSRRVQSSKGDPQRMFDQLQTRLKSIFKTASIRSALTRLNATPDFSQKLTMEQLNDILFFAYEERIQLDLLTKRLLECLQPIDGDFSSHSFIEFVNLLVLHQQKYYDYQTKSPNKTLDVLLHTFEFSLTEDQIKSIPLVDLSLLCSAMYRLQISLKNPRLLESIGQHLIDDERRKHLFAVDKQNFIKILTLSNYGTVEIASALTNRFNHSFEQHLQSSLNSFSYEIVRMTMRIGMYCLMVRFYSERFYRNCLTLIELESKSARPSYRAKDTIQIMNALIYMGYVRTNTRSYTDLINTYDRMNQFEQRPERLVDVLAPLAMIADFPENLLEKLFTKEHLNRMAESRLKEKLFFLSQSHNLLCSPQRPLLDQNYLDSLPHHLFGSWTIEKRKRPYFSIVMERLLECVPNRSYVKSAFLLKHFKSPDIIICLNGNQQPQTIPKETNKSIGFFDENENTCLRYALEVLTEEEVCTNEPLRPLGLFYSKARQLQKLSYVPVIIYPNDSLHRAKDVFEWIVQRAKATELLLKEN